MNKFFRLKELHMEKKKYFRSIVILEAVIILLGIINLFGKNAVYECGINSATACIGEYSDGKIKIAPTDNAQEKAVCFAIGTFKAGSYLVQLDYDTDTNARNVCYVTDSQVPERFIQTNGAQLFEGLHSTNYDFKLLRNTDTLEVCVSYEGEGELVVKGLTIRQTNALQRVLLSYIVLICFIINTICVFVEYDRKYSIPVKSRKVIFGLGMTILLASLPLSVDTMIPGGDLLYHLMRVEGIKDGILAGQFPIRISPEWQQGYGYASPIFYGETFLYIAAALRLIGFSITSSYRWFMFMVVVATVLIAYKCFDKIFNDEYIGVFCALIYSISVYRVYKTYYCGSWGECFGVMLLPIIVYGFYRVFTQDIAAEGYKNNWGILTLGFSLLIQSHFLTCEMVGVFTIVLCIILYKKVFRKATFIVLAKTVIYSILLSAWFLVPFVDYMLSGDFVIQHVSGRTIQSRGLFPAHLFMTFIVNGENVFFEYNGMAQSAATGIGAVLIISLVIYFFIRTKKDWCKLSRDESDISTIAAVFSVMAMTMSLYLFPWDRIQSINDITATLVSSIQFPNRFLTIANVGLTVVFGAVTKCVFNNNNKKYRVGYCGVVMTILLAGNVYLMEWCMNEDATLRVYNSGGMGTGYISGGEYLPYGANPERFIYHDPNCEEGLSVSEYEKLSLGASMHVKNETSEDKSVSLPLLFYKGYKAFDINSGRELKCYAGDNFEVTVNVPSGCETDVAVRFVSPIHWRIAELTTFVFLIVIIASGYIRRKKRTIITEVAE